MKVFLDTNVFYNDWFMRNANFKYLFHFLNNEGHALILSNLVIEESENIRNRELSGVLSEITINVKRAQKMNSKALNFDVASLGIENYELIPLIKSRAESVEEIGYNHIPHSEVVTRALLNKKPFMEGEKGYRDTLIWLSFIDHLANNDVDEDVVFITQNKSDFFKIKDKIVKFHPDLAGDLEQKKIKASVIPFTSLFDFINNTVNKDEHAIDHYGSEEIFEEFIEDSATEFLECMSNTDLSLYLHNSIFETKVKSLLDIRVEVFEGLEDPEVMHTHRLDKNDIYVSYRYNLRNVILEIDIPAIDYTLNKDALNSVSYEVEVSNEIATLRCFIRPYFDVSFIYNDRDETLKNYEVADLLLRQ